MDLFFFLLFPPLYCTLRYTMCVLRAVLSPGSVLVCIFSSFTEQTRALRQNILFHRGRQRRGQLLQLKSVCMCLRGCACVCFCMCKCPHVCLSVCVEKMRTTRAKKRREKEEEERGVVVQPSVKCGAMVQEKVRSVLSPSGLTSEASLWPRHGEANPLCSG